MSGSFRRIGWLAVQTARGLVRSGVPAALLVMAILVVLGGWSLRGIDSSGDPAKFVADFGLAALSVFSAVLAVLATAQVFFGGLESGGVATAVAHGVRRGEWLAGIWGGVALVLAAAAATLTGLVVGLAMIPGAAPWADEPAPAGPPFAALAFAGLLQWLKAVLASAVTLLVASYARSSLFTGVVSLLVLTIGHVGRWAETFVGAGATGPGARWLSLAVQAFPDLRLFAIADAWPDPAQPFGAVAYLGRVLAYAAVYIAACGAAAMLVFRTREL